MRQQLVLQPLEDDREVYDRRLYKHFRHEGRVGDLRGEEQTEVRMVVYELVAQPYQHAAILIQYVLYNQVVQAWFQSFRRILNKQRVAKLGLVLYDFHKIRRLDSGHLQMVLLV